MILKQLFKFLNENEKTVLIIFFAISLVLRTTFACFSYAKTGNLKWSDDFYYLSMGEQIAQGNWDPEVEGRPHMVIGPVIPFLIASFIKLFGDTVIPMFIYNIIVTSIPVFVLYYLGKDLFNRETGWFIALWGVFFIEYFKYTTHILKESSLFLFVPITILLLLRAAKNNYSLKYLFLSSLSFEVLVHTDERFIVYFPVFVLAFLLVKPLTFRECSKPMLTWIGLVLLFMLPWGIRNYVVFDQVVILTPRTTVITSKLWGENLEAATSHFTDDNVRKKLNQSRYQEAVEFGRQYGIAPYEQGKNEARIKAFFNFWQPTYFNPTFIQYGYRTQKWSPGHNMAGLMFYGIFLPFYLIGIIILIKKKHFAGLFLASIPIIHSLLHAYMVWPLERYRSPVTFIVVIIGIWVIFCFYENIKYRFSSNDL